MNADIVVASTCTAALTDMRADIRVRCRFLTIENKTARYLAGWALPKRAHLNAPPARHYADAGWNDGMWWPV